MNSARWITGLPTNDETERRPETLKKVSGNHEFPTIASDVSSFVSNLVFKV